MYAKTEFRVSNEMPWSDSLALYIGVNSAGVRSTAEPLIMKTMEPGLIVQPALRMAGDEAQQLMDELWRCGLRPSEGTGSAGSLAATERHLKDMRDVAMGLLRKTGVQV